MRSRKFRQVVDENVSRGPAAFFESRTPPASKLTATSTQSLSPPPLWLLFRHSSGFIGCSPLLEVACQPGNELPRSCLIEGNARDSLEDALVVGQIDAVFEELARRLVLNA